MIFRIDLKARGQAYDINELLPPSNTLKQMVDHTLSNCLANVLPQIFETMKQNGCALTFDFSSDNADFLVIMVHFIEEWSLKNFVLSFTPIANYFSKNSENIRFIFLRQMSSYGFDRDDVKNMGIVANKGGNVRDIFKTYG